MTYCCARAPLCHIATLPCVIPPNGTPPLLRSRPSQLAKAVYTSSTRAPANPRTAFSRSQAATQSLDVIQVRVYDTGVEFEGTAATSVLFDSPRLTVRRPVRRQGPLDTKSGYALGYGVYNFRILRLATTRPPNEESAPVQPILRPCVYVQWVDTEVRPFRFLRMTGRLHPGRFLDPDSREREILLLIQEVR